MKKALKTDLIIAAIVVLLIIASAVLFIPHRGGGAVCIYVGGELYETVAPGDARTVTVDQGGGKVNVIEVTKDSVRMEISTCPNQDCVMKGTLSRNEAPGLISNWIICLPNAVSVTFSEQ